MKLVEVHTLDKINEEFLCFKKLQSRIPQNLANGSTYHFVLMKNKQKNQVKDKLVSRKKVVFFSTET